MIHELKILKPFADAIAAGDKNFEIRYNDRGFQKGDLVRFRVKSDQVIHADGVEFNPNPHPIEALRYRITYVLNGWGLQEDYVAFGIQPIPREDGA